MTPGLLGMGIYGIHSDAQAEPPKTELFARNVLGLKPGETLDPNFQFTMEEVVNWNASDAGKKAKVRYMEEQSDKALNDSLELVADTGKELQKGAVSMGAGNFLAPARTALGPFANTVASTAMRLTPQGLVASTIPMFEGAGSMTETGQAIANRPPTPNMSLEPILPIQLPTGALADTVNRGFANTVLGVGAVADAFSPVTIRDAVKARNFNPHNLPINEETGMPMARPMPTITGIRALRPTPNWYMEFPGIMIPGTGKLEDMVTKAWHSF